jgi:hypothetical protein
MSDGPVIKRGPPPQKIEHFFRTFRYGKIVAAWGPPQWTPSGVVRDEVPEGRRAGGALAEKRADRQQPVGAVEFRDLNRERPKKEDAIVSTMQHAITHEDPPSMA